MSPEVSLFGVFVPGLLIVGVLALVATALLTRVFGLIGFYRLIAYRPLVDLALFMIVLGIMVFLLRPDSFLP